MSLGFSGPGDRRTRKWECTRCGETRVTPPEVFDPDDCGECGGEMAFAETKTP